LKGRKAKVYEDSQRRKVKEKKGRNNTNKEKKEPAGGRMPPAGNGRKRIPAGCEPQFLTKTEDRQRRNGNAGRNDPGTGGG